MKPRVENVKYAEFALIGVAFVAGFAANMERRAHTTVVTRTVKVEKSWGKPDDTAAADKVISAQLAQTIGLTTCDLYASRRTVVCHP